MNKILTFLLLLLVTQANAQTVNKKMGNPTMEEMTMTSYADDSEAKAVILWESNDSYMQLVGNSIKLVMEYKRRVKVLHEDALDVADVTLTIQDAESSLGIRNDLRGIKATAYNLVDGKIEKTKMTSATITKKRLNENMTETHFVIPQVKVGSVVEYQYEIFFENFWDIPTWIAQCRYPVLRSDYCLRLPDSFVFRFQQSGSHHANHTQKDVNNSSLGTNDIQHTFSWDNLPALPKDSEYLFCPTDFADKVSCELSSIMIPGHAARTFSVTQDDIVNKLLEYDNFGGKLRQKNPLHKEMEEAGIFAMEDVMEKAKATTELLRKRVRWDEKYNLVGTSLSKVLKDGKGDNADMNFILISMLRDTGIKCYPVVMSRRSRGRLPIAHPSLEALNTFCIAFYEDDSTVHFFDTSAENGFFDVLPVNMIVDRGIIINDIDKTWDEVNLQEKINSRMSSSISAEINTDGTITGTYACSLQNVAAMRFRDSWEAKNDSTAFVNSIAADENIEITDFNTTNRENFSPSMKEQFTFTRQLDGDDKIYINPLFFSSYQESPFKAETSSMPVEFPCLSNRSFNISIKYPTGYHVEECIAPLSISLPNNAGSVKIIARAAEENIAISAKVAINRTFFTAEEYPALKQFYDLIAQKCNEMIIIAKD